MLIASRSRVGGGWDVLYEDPGVAVGSTKITKFHYPILCIMHPIFGTECIFVCPL